MPGQVAAKEFERRKAHLCTLPFNGITITARGEITLCCEAPHIAIKQLKDIPDLRAFYNDVEMGHFRTEMEENRIASLPTCDRCFKRYSEGNHSMMTVANEIWRDILVRHFDADWQLRKEGKTAPIRFLEYTCSNICNQTCATCSSFFSSKWRDIEQQFSGEEKQQFERYVHDIQSLTDDDIQKIIKILPDLSIMVIKGGEPWADKNNIAILDRALDVNPQCEFLIVSNMQAISASTLRVLEKVRTNGATNFRVSASIDGTGRVYDWIRGGAFERTVQNMRAYYEVTGLKVDVSPFISIQNYFEIERIIEYFMDKEFVHGIIFNNISKDPDYIRLQNLPPSICDARHQVLQASFPEYRERMNNTGKYLVYEPLLHDIKADDPFSPSELKRSIQWIEKMNQVRGFRLQDHVTELREITEMAMAY